ncbi:MAG: CYTH domain-containing protein [Chloroflexota bacterium]|nr:CYTH domain-containing protein [Chloroflexota bacterium]
MTAARIEAELKFWADDEAPLRELATATRLGPAELLSARIVDEVDRYLDTADLRLATARWACRLRSRDGRTFVSLKGPSEHEPGDALHRRPEVEGPVGPGLLPRAWPPSAARDQLLAMTAGAALVERFSLEQQRTERAVLVDGARIGLLSLDRGTIVRRGVEVGRLAVVELELDPAALEKGMDHASLAVALAAVPGLVADPSSKLERALALLSG